MATVNFVQECEWTEVEFDRNILVYLRSVLDKREENVVNTL